MTDKPCHHQYYLTRMLVHDGYVRQTYFATVTSREAGRAYAAILEHYGQDMAHLYADWLAEWVADSYVDFRVMADEWGAFVAARAYDNYGLPTENIRDYISLYAAELDETCQA